MLNKPTSRRLAERVLPWVAFSGMLLWGWRVWDIFNNVPAYQDVLEIAWGINWYYDSLFVRHVSPGFTPMIFHPLGWHVFTFGYPPLIFLLALPLKMLGGVAFAFNVLTLASVGIAFVGAHRFARLYTGEFVGYAAALVFTFSEFRFFRVAGHLNIALMTALLPWFLWALERLRRADSQRDNRKLILLCGILWGLTINSALYGIFLGLTCFALWGRALFRLARLKQATIIAIIAIVIASPAILLYIIGSRADVTMGNGPGSLQAWSASLNSLFIPSAFHPLEPIRSLARTVYSGPLDESGIANIGLVTTVLALIGLWGVLRSQGEARRLLWLAGVGLVLALGLTLRWNGQTIPIAFFSVPNSWLWRVGSVLKPEFFGLPDPPASLATGLPLPGFIAAVAIPFWESARVVSRYAFVGGIAMIVLATLGLQRIGRIGRVLAVGLWLVETLPNPTASMPLIDRPHPAFAWIAQQRLPPGEGIVDLAAPSLAQGGEIIYATLFHHAPTASIVGSSWPEFVMPLSNFFANDDNLARTSAALMLEQYNVRYVVFHLRGMDERRRWDLMLNNSLLQSKGCFEPIKEQSPWPYPICIAEVTRSIAPGIQVALNAGWSIVEPWGVWADQKESWAGWLAPASAEPVYLALEARPNCQPDLQQEIMITVNDVKLPTHVWDTCTTWKASLPIPAQAIQKGWNTIRFQYAYDERQGDEVANNDDRTVAVAFTHLSVEYADKK